MAEVLRFTVPPDGGGMNAKWFLKSRCGLSTRMITRLKREKDGIMMNGKILRTVDPVEAGAELLIHLPQEENSFLEPVEGELDILFEDSHLLVINKPPFMPVHPVKQHRTDTLANRVAWYAAQKGEPFIFRAHNRLDRNTSGLVLLAKDKFTVNALKGQVHKVYFALVHGKMEGSGTVSAPIGLHDDSKIVRHVVSEGNPAVTHYQVLYSTEEISFLRLVLETGKTHQIRCHMSHIGHPLAGDDLYGGSLRYITRQALHCQSVRFTHPDTKEAILLSTEIPTEFLNIIHKEG
jgi:23S rRNA pseudouridine1911/1915/1917 synthase